MGKNGHLTTRELCELFGVCPQTIGLHVRAGVLKRAPTSGRAFQFDQADVIEYWRTYRRGACVRCGIHGEAHPETGFMCEPCEYESRTGRMWWPDVRQRALPRGRLTIDLEAYDDWALG